jgi:hypothetical protein
MVVLKLPTGGAPCKGSRVALRDEVEIERDGEEAEGVERTREKRVKNR